MKAGDGAVGLLPDPHAESRTHDAIPSITINILPETLLMFFD
jgi:hypothetical protein